MRNSEMIQSGLRTLLDLLLIIFITPLIFVFVYFFPLFLTGSNLEGLVKSLAKFAFHVSWVSAPLLVAAMLLLKVMIRRELRWVTVLLASFATGILWLLLWNLIIEDLFTLWRSLIPLAVCCLSSMAYVMARTLYQDDRMNFSKEPDYEFRGDRRAEGADGAGEAADTAAEPSGEEPPQALAEPAGPGA